VRRVVRPARATILALALALAAVPAGAAHAASWTAVSGLIPGSATDAALDGPRVVVTSVSGRDVVLTTIEDDRVARRQILTTAGRRGGVRWLQVIRVTGGRALAAWEERGVIRASLRPSAGARFSPARTVSAFPPAPPGVTPGVGLHPAVGATSTGEVVLAWWGGPANGRLGIYASSLAAGGSWSPAVEVSAGTYPQLPRPIGPLLGIAIAADQAGGLGVAWRQPAGQAEEIRAVMRSPDGTWGAPVLLGSGRIGPGAPQAAAPSPGELVAAWTAYDAGNRPCAVAAVLRGGAVTRDDVMCDVGNAIDVVRTPSGGVILASGGSSVQVSARQATAGWTPPQLALTRVGAFSGAVGGTGGRSAIPVVVEGTGGQFNRVRVAIVGADGAVLRRIAGPGRPTPPRHTGVRILPLGPGARVAMLLTRAPTIISERVSILTLG
jgi:hypothetical protein